MSSCPSAVESLDCNLRAIHPYAWSLHYLRFALSFRDIEDLPAERGVAVSHETIRQWCEVFGPQFAWASRHVLEVAMIDGFKRA